MADSCETCSASGRQYLDFNIPVELAPNAVIRGVVSECCGEPEVCCVEAPCCDTCEITVTQRVRIRISVRCCPSARVGNVQIRPRACAQGGGCLE